MTRRCPTPLAHCWRVCIVGLANPDPASPMQLLSVTRRFESFNAGMIDSADLIWHVVVITLFLALTVRRLDRDRLIGQAS